jgi:molybdopterin converting factor small subunit
MSVRVRIPTPLRPHAGGQAALSLGGETVQAVLAALIEAAPGLRTQLLAEDGSLRSFVNVYVNGEDVRARSGLETPLADGDELAIVPAIAGGRHEGPADAR